MADEYMKYGFDELDQCGLRLFNIIKATETIKDSYDGVASNLQSSWEGQARNAFDERAKHFKDSINKLYEELMDSKNKLDYAVSTMRPTEELLVKKVDQLNDDDIF